MFTPLCDVTSHFVNKYIKINNALPIHGADNDSNSDNRFFRRQSLLEKFNMAASSQTKENQLHCNVECSSHQSSIPTISLGN